MTEPVKTVSVILPTYNERENVIPLIAGIKTALKDVDYEVLVVDDNSPDGTADAVDALGDPRVRAIRRTTDRGFARSIRCGLESAQGDLLIVMDSDGNHQPTYLPFMIEALRYYDCVSGSRFVYGGRMSSRSRHLLSWSFNIFARVATSGMVTDSLYGFIGLRRSVLKRVRFDDVFFGYGDYCIRLMYYLQREGVEILQFPVVNGRRVSGEGNSRFFAVFWQYFREVLALTYRERLRGGEEGRSR